MKKILRGFFLFTFTILISSSFVSSLQADFAIYSGSGTWEPSKTAFKNFLEWKGLTWKEITKNDINNGLLIGNYRGLFMPGGWAGDYNRDIKNSGDQHIRNFVSGGGAYIGMSAGAYYACDVTIWEGNVYNYPSDMFNGDCIGPIPEIAPWPNYVMTTMSINQAHEANIYEPANRDILYYGEPYFVAHPGQEMQVFATWNVPANPTANGTPGIIGFNYGNGRLLLVGPHPEIDEDDARDGTNFADELSDGPDGSDWPFIWTGVDWILKQPITQPPGTQPKQCNDLIDNDLDGFIDFPNDPGCTDLTDDDETDPLPFQCEDGLDNDGDLLIDMNDTGCSSPSDNNETDIVPVQCSDGLDNDSDGLTDYPTDPGCVDVNDDDETDPTGPVEIFSEGFESGSLSGWLIYGTGTPWKISSGNPNSGTFHVESKQSGAGNPTYLERAISTSGFTSLSLEYYRKLIGLDAADDFSVEWFDGSIWDALEHVSSESNSIYIYKTYNLPIGAENNSNFKLRFMCEAGAVSEFCRVDNVRILAL